MVNAFAAQRLSRSQWLIIATVLIVVTVFILSQMKPSASVGGKAITTTNKYDHKIYEPSAHIDMTQDVTALNGKLSVTLLKTVTDPPFLMFTLNDDRDFVSRTLRTHMQWSESHLTTLIRKRMLDRCKQGAYMFDVGANLGFFSMYASAMGCKVHAFEMQPLLISLVRMSHTANPDTHGTIDIVQTAVAETSGKTVTVSLFLGGGDLGSAGIANDKMGGFKDAITAGSVKTTAIDDYVAQVGIDKIGYMKMDVEGYEWEAVQGLKKTLKRGALRDILIETRKFNFDRMIELMTSMGYTAYDTGSNGAICSTKQGLADMHSRNPCPSNDCFTDIFFTLDKENLF